MSLDTDEQLFAGPRPAVGVASFGKGADARIARLETADVDEHAAHFDRAALASRLPRPAGDG